MLASYNNDILDFKLFADTANSITKDEKIKQFTELLKDPDIKEVLNSIFAEYLATSDLKILKRLSEVETILGLNDFADFEDEHKITIPEQLSILAERIDYISEPAARKPTQEPAYIPTGKTEVRACLLVDHLKLKDERLGTKFLTSEEIVHFLRYGVEEQYKVKEDQNVRQVKREVLEKAVKLFSDNVFLSQKKQGRKNVRIVYRS